MRKVVFNLLKEAQQKMSAYAAYLNYQLIHFSVKAEPAALLAVTVHLNETDLNLEEVADVALPEENQFALIPKDQAYLFPICKGIGAVHPDYKIEQKSMQEEQGTDSGEASSEEGEDKYILCTMPAVNKDRHDAGMEYVKTVYDETLSKIEATQGAYTAKITQQLANAKEEEIDEAKDELKKLHDQHLDLCKSYREEKEKQIEEAYQQYQQEQAAQESAEQEKHAAHSQAAGKQFHLGDLASEANG